MNDNNENTKKILIIGTNNKYQIKKLKKDEIVVCTRKNIEKLDLLNEDFLHETQLKVFKCLFENDNYNNSNNSDDKTQKMLIELNKKINNYKYQDIKKGVHNTLLFISLKEVMNLLYLCKLKCLYCTNNIYLFYKNVRDKYQWTLDRIDNSIGHNNQNVVICCLDCNLKRRCTNKDAFLFTKQLNIIRL